MTFSHFHFLEIWHDLDQKHFQFFELFNFQRWRHTTNANFDCNCNCNFHNSNNTNTYTQEQRTIVTSVSLRAPTRVSSDFCTVQALFTIFRVLTLVLFLFSTLKITGGCRCLLTWTTQKLARGRLFTGTEILCAAALSAMGDFSAEHKNIHMTKNPKPNCWGSTPTVPGVQKPREKMKNVGSCDASHFQQFVGRTPTHLLSICVTQNQPTSQ